ncbi:hypothetical protein [Proteiniphilum sp. UBA5384]|uniref:hypothetical protein n=1 Tax=Proteiniphilum sp. UBA5384 TaxID=1947279 RepID=UPI0025F619D7|nr:hypothetical protein [Proteiniphilum sp. UBA5384]
MLTPKTQGEYFIAVSIVGYEALHTKPFKISPENRKIALVDISKKVYIDGKPELLTTDHSTGLRERHTGW